MECSVLRRAAAGLSQCLRESYAEEQNGRSAPQRCVPTMSHDFLVPTGAWDEPVVSARKFWWPRAESNHRHKDFQTRRCVSPPKATTRSHKRFNKLQCSSCHDVWSKVVVICPAVSHQCPARRCGSRPRASHIMWSLYGSPLVPVDGTVRDRRHAAPARACSRCSRASRAG